MQYSYCVSNLVHLDLVVFLFVLSSSLVGCPVLGNVTVDDGLHSVPHLMLWIHCFVPLSWSISFDGEISYSLCHGPWPQLLDKTKKMLWKSYFIHAKCMIITLDHDLKFDWWQIIRPVIMVRFFFFLMFLNVCSFEVWILFLHHIKG